MQELRAAVERLGQGDFRARVRSSRKDELGALAETFDRMADRVERAVASQRQLVQDVSHELRSPLSRLSVAIELARTGPDPEAALDRVEQEAKRLNELVAELLAVSRDQITPAPETSRRCWPSWWTSSRSKPKRDPAGWRSRRRRICASRETSNCSVAPSRTSPATPCYRARD